MWGPLAENNAHLLHSFDAVIGSELMYYKTDVSLLSATVKDVLAPLGVFIHTHHFRVSGLQQDLLESMESVGLVTLECNPVEFLGEEDKRHHPEWLQIKCLISTLPGQADKLLTDCTFLKRFVAPSEFEESGSDDDDEPQVKISADEIMAKYNVKI